MPRPSRPKKSKPSKLERDNTKTMLLGRGAPAYIVNSIGTNDTREQIVETIRQWVKALPKA